MFNGMRRYLCCCGLGFISMVLAGCVSLPEKSGLHHYEGDQVYKTYKADLKDLKATPVEDPVKSVDTLSQAQAVQWALQRNAQVQQAAWEIEKQRLSVKQEALWANPEIEAELENVKEGAFKIALTLPLDLTAKKGAQSGIETIAFQQAQLSYVMTCQSVEADVKRCYAGVQAVSAGLTIFDQALALSEEIVVLSKKRYRSGAGSKVDVIYAEMDLARARHHYEKLKAEAMISKNKLASLWGDKKSNYKQVEPFSEVFEKIINEKQLEHYIEQMPVVQHALLEKKKRYQAYQKSWRHGFEDVSLTGSYAQDQENGQETLGAAVGLVLPLFDRNQHNHRVQAIAARQGALAARQALVEAGQRTNAFYNELLLRFKEVRLYDKTIIPSLKTAYDESIRFYQKGRLPLIELVRVKNEWLESKLAFQEKSRDFWIALSNLEEAFGKNWKDLNEVEK